MSGGAGRDGVDRRSVLGAGAAALAVGTSGCIDTVRSVVNGSDPTFSVSITTVPADDDRASIQIARRLEQRLEAAGANVTLDVRTYTDFLEAVLLDNDFELFVGPHPGARDPDFLYETLHSMYADEAGWQNPYGFPNVTFDDLLERQRDASPDERPAEVAAMLRAFVREKPFVPICVPEDHRLVRTDRYPGLEGTDLSSPTGYLGLDPSEPEHAETFTAIVTDSRPSVNQNPMAAEYRIHGPIPDLVYDSLAIVDGGEYRPWLAESWQWLDDDPEEPDGDAVDDSTSVPDRVDGSSAAGPTAEITIRQDCRFHDDEPVTASDVEFTYEFLRDTTLGRGDGPVPPTMYRGLGEAVHSAEVVGDRRLQVTFAAGVSVANRALTVPILPEHVWREEVESVADSNLPRRQRQWGPLSSSSVELIGSGPYTYADSDDRNHLALERFDDHFSFRVDDLPTPSVEELEFLVDPSSASAVQHVASGPVDATTSPVEPYAYGEATEVENADVQETASHRFYHVGFNVRRAPFRNPYVRRTIAQLLSPEAIVEDVFHGRARPVSVPVEESWVPADLEWRGEDPVSPFLGTDGELDEERARRAFETIGFRYDEDGQLVGN